jgi:hypothetical protein
MAMSADLTTVVVAVLGVAGTLSSPLLAQRVAARARQQEFSLQSQERREDRQEANSRSAFQERRSTYAALNTSARSYVQQLRAYLRVIAEGSVTDDDRAGLAVARQGFRDVFSDAQMILPDRVLDAALEVNSALGDAYGMIKRLENGEPRAAPADGPAETIDTVGEYCRERLYELTGDLRQLMREDLGVAGAGDA